MYNSLEICICYFFLHIVFLNFLWMQIMDHFAAVFTMVDARVFQDVLHSQLPFLFSQMVNNQSAISIPQHFLANPGVSRMFAELLLDFLMKRIGY